MTTIQVHRLAGGRARSHEWEAGAIQLRAGGRQTIFHGPVARCYRVACDEGGLLVVVDGVEVGLLLEGASMDVVGGSIAVCCSDLPATGAYRPVAG